MNAKSRHGERFTIRTMPKRGWSKLGEDPMRAVLDTTPDLAGALDRLIARVRGDAR